MANVFKKNQPIIAILPTGRVVEGIYIEPYGERGHSFYVNEFVRMRGDKKIYEKKMYGVLEEFIKPLTNYNSTPSEEQYEAWVKRAEILQIRIDKDNKSFKEAKSENEREKIKEKIERNSVKLAQINEKINSCDFEIID